MSTLGLDWIFIIFLHNWANFLAGAVSEKKTGSG